MFLKEVYTPKISVNNQGITRIEIYGAEVYSMDVLLILSALIVSSNRILFCTP